MGCSKCLLEIAGVPSILRVADALRSVCTSVYVVGGADLSPLGLQSLPDRFPGEGPLGAVVTAMRAFAGSDCFFAPCDAPLLQPGIVALLQRCLEGYDAAAAEIDGRLMPLPAACAAGALPRLERAFSAGVRSVARALDTVSVCRVKPDMLVRADAGLVSFLPMNCAEDAARADALWREMHCQN
jgi:molybdopterin-guanine dinucleotide biosynthesis protein A